MLEFSIGVLACAAGAGCAIVAWHLFSKQVGLIEASLKSEALAKSDAIAAKITQEITKGP
jgi:hypothetical protein